MNRSLSYKKLFLAAGILTVVSALISSVLNIAELVNGIIFSIRYGYGFSLFLLQNWSYIISFIPLFITIVSGIVLVVKRDNSIIYVILHSICTAITLVISVFSVFSASSSLISNMDAFLMYRIFSPIISYIHIIITNPITMLTTVITLLLCILSLIYKNKRCKLLSAWFVPGALMIINLLLSIISTISTHVICNDIRIDYFSLVITILSDLNFILSIGAILLLCLGLYKANKQKAELTEEEKEILVNEKSPDNTKAEDTVIPVINKAKTTAPASKPAAPEIKKTRPAAPTSKPAYHTSLHPCDEIVKYKKLLDEGIITQEEFDTKKKQILDL